MMQGKKHDTYQNAIKKITRDNVEIYLRCFSSTLESVNRIANPNPKFTG